MAHLFPTELDLPAITIQVEQLAQLLNDVAAERYSVTLRIMLANLRRKMGLSTAGRSTPIGPMSLQNNDSMILSPSFVPEGGRTPITGAAPFTMEELGFAWPSDWGTISPSAIPPWLQEQASQLFPPESSTYFLSI